jgi:hypothetical protein
VERVAAATLHQRIGGQVRRAWIQPTTAPAVNIIIIVAQIPDHKIPDQADLEIAEVVAGIADRHARDDSPLAVPHEGLFYSNRKEVRK